MRSLSGFRFGFLSLIALGLTLGSTLEARAATAPTTQASNITFSNVTPTGFTIASTAGNGSRYLIVVKAGSAITGTPVNGTSYNGNTTFGSGATIAAGEYSVYSGNHTASVSVTGLTPGTTYFVRIYEYNIGGGAPNPAYQTATATGNPASQTTPPAVSSINRAGTTPTNATTLNFTVTFSESVTGVDAGDFALAAAGVTGVISAPTGGPTIYTVSVTSVSGNGTLGLNLVDNDSIASTANGAKLGGTGNSNGNFTGQTYTVDQTQPTCTLSSAVGANTNAAFTVTATFNQSVINFVAGDVSVTNGAVSGFSGSGTTYSWTVTPSAQGSVQVSVATNVATDSAGNGNTASNTISTNYDNVVPIATVTGPASPTNSNPIIFTINFSESVTGLAVGEITVTNGTKGTLTGSGAGPYLMPVTPTAQGAVTCRVIANAAQDSAGNNNTISNLLSITFDSTAPTATVTGPASPTNSNPINFTINFSESVTGLLDTEITVTGGTKGALTGSGSGPYTLPVTPTGQGAVTCQVTAGAAQDSAGNNNTISNLLNITYDSVAPTATVTGPGTATNTSPFNFTINFSESVTGLTVAEITVTGATKGVLTGTGAGPYTLPVTPTGQGAVTCQIIAGAAADTAGNTNAASNNLSVTYDTVAPTATVTGPASPTGTSPINFIINFSESVTGLTAAEITVINGAKGTLTGSGSGPYTLPVTPSAQGNVTCQVIAGAAQDAAGNNNTVSNNLSINYDSAVPTVTVTGPASPTNGSPINFIINFSESVTGLTAAEITVTNGTKGTLTGSGAGPYTLPVTPLAQGAVTCQVPADAAQDGAVNGNTVSNNLSITYDSIGPVPTIIAPASPTNDNPLVFTITFDEAASNLNAADVIIVNGIKVGPLNGSGAGPYILNVEPTADGIVSIQIRAGGVTDAAGNPSSTAGSSVVYDSLPPTATISGPAVATKVSPIVLTINFSEPVTGLLDSEINVTGATKGTLTGSGAGPYTLPLTPTGEGTITCQVIADAAQDASSNGNTISNLYSVVYDTVAPTATVTGPASPTNNNPINFIINFSEDVTGLTEAEINVTGGTKGTLTGTGAGPYTLPVTPNGEGTVTCQVIADAAQDAATNGNTQSNLLSLTFDSIAPTVALSSAVGSQTNVAFTVSALFSEDVINFDDTDISVTNGSVSGFNGSGDSYSWTVTPTAQGAVQVSIAGAVATDPAGNPNSASNTISTNFDSIVPAIATITPADGETLVDVTTIEVTFTEGVSGVAAGDLTVNGSAATNVTGSGSGPYVFTGFATPVDGAVAVVLAAGAIQDPAANAFAGATWNYTKDSTALTVTLSSAVANGQATNTGPVSFTATFIDDVTNFDASDLIVSNATVGNFNPVSAMVYTFDLTASGEGTVTVTIPANVADSVNVIGKKNTASSLYSFTHDVTAPTVVLASPAGAQVNGPFTVNATFSESVANFDSSDVAVLNGAVSGFVGAGTSYSWTVTPALEGTVEVSVNASVATDNAGNDNSASNTISTEYDATAPTSTVTGAASPTNTAPISFSITFSEPVTGLTTAGLSLSNGTFGTLSGAGAGPYLIDITPSAQGPVTLQVKAAGALDAAGNGNTASNVAAVVYDTIAPVALVTGPASPTNGSPINFTIDFSESVSGLDVSEITVTGGVKGTLTGSGAGPYTLPVTPSGEGTVEVQVDANAAQDDAGNLNAASNLLSITYDTVAPTVVVTGPDSPTNNNPINFIINFSEPVAGFTAAGIDVSGGTKGTLVGSGAGPYTLPVAPSGQGTVSCEVPAGAAQDLAGNDNLVSNSLSIEFDSIAPTPTVTGPVSPTNSAPITFIITFDEPVSGFTSAGLMITGGTPDSFTGTGPYTVEVTPAGDGLVTCQVLAGSALDAAGNGNAASNNLAIAYDTTGALPTITAPASPTNANPILFTVNFDEPVTGLTEAGFTVTGGTAGSLSGSGAGPYTLPVIPAADGLISASVNAAAALDLAGNASLASETASTTYDSVAPTAIVTGPGAPTNSNPIGFTINFSEPVTGLATAGLTVSGGAIDSLTGSGAGPYAVSVIPSGDGMIGVQVNSAAAQDAAGNGNAPSNNFEVNFDATPPTVSLTTGVGTHTNAQFNVTATFSEPVADFEIGDISVDNAFISNFSGSGAVYTWTVELDSDGPVQVVVQSNAALDEAGNGNQPSNTINVTADTTQPTATINGPSSPTNDNPIVLTIFFNEPVIGLDADEFEITGGTVGLLSGSGAGPYTLPVTPTQEGTVTAKLPADFVTDLAGNSNLESNTATFDFDAIPVPVVTGPASPSNVSPILFTVTFSEPVFNLQENDIFIDAGFMEGISGTGAGPYTITVTPDGQGPVTCMLSAGAAQDATGNSTAESNQAEVVYDSIAPTATLTGPNSPTSINPIVFTINFDEPVTGLTLAGITVSGGNKSNLTGSGAGPYTVTVEPTIQGAITCQVNAGAARDAAGNGNSNSASNSLTVIFDTQAPVVILTTTAGAYTNAPFTVTAIFSVDVSGFDLNDVTVTSGTADNFDGSGAEYSWTVIPAGEGPVTVMVNASGAEDEASNGNLPSAELTLIYDATPPTVAIGAPNVRQTKNGPVSFPVAYADATVVDLTAADIVVAANGSVTNVNVVVLFGATPNPIIHLTYVEGVGNLTLSIAPGTAADLAGNLAPASAPSIPLEVSLTQNAAEDWQHYE